MIRRLTRCIGASYPSFKFMRLRDDVGEGAGETVKRHAKLRSYKRLTIHKILGRKTSVGYSMQSTEYLFFT